MCQVAHPEAQLLLWLLGSALQPSAVTQVCTSCRTQLLWPINRPELQLCNQDTGTTPLHAVLESSISVQST